MGRWAADWPASVHMLGVGGIAMSSLAALFARNGVDVRGSDVQVYPPASEVLADSGIEVMTPYDSANLERPASLYVVGNAIARGNPELEVLLERGAPICSMAELIERLLIPGRRPSVVAGTHGKTTTSSMLAHIHLSAGRDPSFFVGGTFGGMESGARLGEGPDIVIEGDEYDTAFFDKGPKFLHYWPQIAVLGPVEFDHADIYRDLEDVERAFERFLRLLPSSGTLVVDGDAASSVKLARAAPGRSVELGFSDGAAARVEIVEQGAEMQTFRLIWPVAGEVEVELPMLGVHNAKNASAAIVAATVAGVGMELAANSLGTFRPPRRRLERIGGWRGAELFDDFAHHPTSIGLTLDALRSSVRDGGRLVACVEPRSNTMVRRIVQDALESTLAKADVVLLAPVHRPERFAAPELLDVEALTATLRRSGIEAHGPLRLESFAGRLEELLRPGDLVVIMSNGAFGGLTHELSERCRVGEA